LTALSGRCYKGGGEGRDAHAMLSDIVIESARRCVLCWLATCDGEGQPNVSPKEVFAPFDAQRLVIANIASPVTARNIGVNPRVCVSFVDVFVQKGFKLTGTARNVLAGDAEFNDFSRPLEAMTQGRFAIRSVFVVDVRAVEQILAPSYRFYPGDTSEASQVESALRTYGVRAMDEGSTRKA
jgi:uncharacterized protein